MPRTIILVAVAILSACGTGVVPDRAVDETSPAVAALETTTVVRNETGTQPGEQSTVAPVVQEGRPNPGTAVGYLTFRGNPAHTFYGTGPVPTVPGTVWRYPQRAMCGTSSVRGVARDWCGTGWPSQAAVVEYDGRTIVFFGAYDHQIHAVDGRDGTAVFEPLRTGDIAKGSPTVDPDGFPLLYTGSRDNLLRIIAFDGGEMRTLWALDGRAHPWRIFNDDWDGAPAVVRDHLVVTGEDGLLHVVKLRRGYDADGRVTVDPVEVAVARGYDDELFAAIGDRNCAFENAVAIHGDRAYGANSCGLVLGWDLRGTFRDGSAPVRVFRYFVGDDVDASVVVDDDGYLYVGVQVDRATTRGRMLGQLLKLDATRPDPLVWSVHAGARGDTGTWSTPAISDTLVVWPTKQGRIYGLDRASGAVLWTLTTAGHTISSPSIVDGTLLQGDGAGMLRAWSLNGSAQPRLLWEHALGSNIESTPAIWRGRIYVGLRGGQFVAVDGR